MFSDLIKFKELLNKLEPLTDAIAEVTALPDGSVYVKTKANIIIEANGHTVLVSKGDVIMQSNTIHLNPSPIIDATGDIDEQINTIKQVSYDATKHLKTDITGITNICLHADEQKT